MQLDLQSSRLMDKPEILAKWHDLPQLCIIDIGRGIKATIARLQDERRCRRQRLIGNQEINVLGATQAEITESLYGKRYALDEQDRQVGIVEQTLQPQR